MQDRKRIDFELMRILAAFFVIFNHTQLRGVVLYTLEDPRSIFSGFISPYLYSAPCPFPCF